MTTKPHSNDEERPPKVIFLSKGQFTLVDEKDYDYLNQFKWHANIYSTGYLRKYYVTRSDNVNKTKIKMSRDIMKPGEGMVVDHINGNPLDNRRSNLRVCTIKENSMNRVANFKNKYGRKGVTMKHGLFATSITVNGKAMYLGSYKTADEAGDVYDEAAKKYHGKYHNVEPNEIFYNQEELNEQVSDARREEREKIGKVPAHVLVPTQWDTGVTYGAYIAGAKDRHQFILDSITPPDQTANPTN